MGGKSLSGCFVLHIILSLLLHLAELVTNGMLAYALWVSDDIQHKWFSLVTGIIIIPLVLIQLLSAILLLNRRGDSLTTCQSIVMAVLHLLQMGFTWRHVAVITEKDTVNKKADVAELFLLRMTYGFASGFPLMFVHAYLILEQMPLLWTWILYAAAGASLLSTSWALASFQRQHETCDAEDIVLPWPGMVFKLLWRTGEIISRIVSLALFATLYREWIFLVISLHWLTMLVCVCTTVFSAVSDSIGSMAYKVSFRVLVAYMYVFAFINFSHVNPMFRYIMFYIIMFLENGTLNIVWMLKSSQDIESRYLMVFISAAAFFVAIMSVAVYYKFFHVSISNVPEEGKTLVCVQKGCINCKLSMCVKHKLKMQRPFSTGWFSQYSNAVYNGQYYKNILHDSLLDDTYDSDSKSLMGGLGYTDYHIYVGKTKYPCQESNHHENRSTVSFQSAGTYVHRRYIDTDDTEVMSNAAVDNSLDLKELYPRGQVEEALSDESSLGSGPPWLPPHPKTKTVSQTCLLTDNWDSLSELEIDNSNKRRSLASCRSLMRDSTHNWYSDGYSTDCGTLNWSKLPVTVIGKNRSVVSDSESEYYCHCPFELPNKVRDVKLRTQIKKSKNNNQPSRYNSFTDSEKEQYVHWSRKGTSSAQRPKQKTEAINQSTIHNTNTVQKANDAFLSDIDREINHAHTTSTDVSCVNVCETRSRNQHGTCKYKQIADDSSKTENENVHVTESVNMEETKQKNMHRIDNFVAESFSKLLKIQEDVLFPKMDITAPVIGSQHSSFKPVIKNNLGKSNSNQRTFNEKCVPSKDKIIPKLSNGIENMANDDLHSQVIMTSILNKLHNNNNNQSKTTRYFNQNGCEQSYSRSKDVIYANIAFVEDDGVFLDDPIVVRKDAPWYDCSESEDSAFPQEMFSSSNCEASNSEAESYDSLELII